MVMIGVFTIGIAISAQPNDLATNAPRRWEARRLGKVRATVSRQVTSKASASVAKGEALAQLLAHAR